MLPSFEEYNILVYGIIERPSVKGSTLVLKPIGATVWEVEGEVTFAGDIILSVLEQINFALGAITRYFYLVRRGDERLYWSEVHYVDQTPLHPVESAIGSSLADTVR